jgi:hypothetical protein
MKFKFSFLNILFPSTIMTTFRCACKCYICHQNVIWHKGEKPTKLGKSTQSMIDTYCCKGLSRPSNFFISLTC